MYGRQPPLQPPFRSPRRAMLVALVVETSKSLDGACLARAEIGGVGSASIAVMLAPPDHEVVLRRPQQQTGGGKGGYERLGHTLEADACFAPKEGTLDPEKSAKGWHGLRYVTC